MVSIPDGWLSASSMTRARLRPRGLRGCRVSGNSGSMSAIQNCWVMLSALAQREPKSFIFIRHIFKISSKEFGVLCETLKWVFIWINSFSDSKDWFAAHDETRCWTEKLILTNKTLLPRPYLTYLSFFVCSFSSFSLLASFFPCIFVSIFCLSFYRSSFLSFYVCLSPSLCLSFSICPCLFIFLFVFLSISMFVCLSTFSVPCC